MGYEEGTLVAGASGQPDPEETIGQTNVEPVEAEALGSVGMTDTVPAADVEMGDAAFPTSEAARSKRRHKADCTRQLKELQTTVQARGTAAPDEEGGPTQVPAVQPYQLYDAYTAEGAPAAFAMPDAHVAFPQSLPVPEGQ